MLQETIRRLNGLENLQDPIIICNEEYRFLAAEQLRQISKPSKGIILEPIGKNTAPAIALAALKLINDYKDPLLLVLPADHLIQNIQAFHESIKTAKTLAEKNKLVTFGIVPNKAETGYGYIKADIKNTAKYYNIKSFIEKPSQESANKYLDSGNYLWNSGMFMFKASVYLDELKKFAPKILDYCNKSLQTEYKDLDFIRLKNNNFLQCPEKSIDYAVMEHTKEAIVVPLDANWSDIGSWEALMDSKSKDSNGNVSEGDVLLDDVNNTYAYSSNRLVSVIGVSSQQITPLGSY